MDELLMCSICIERYHEGKRQPVLLPRCGHSFCRLCVAMLISGGCIICPTCRTDQRVDFVERLPTEYTLLAIINAQENSLKETCERHSVKLSFWCRSCNVATCGECLFEDHPTHSHDVIRASKYIQDMKETAQGVAIKFIEVLDEREQSYYKTIFNCTRKISVAIRSIGALRKDMVEARELMKGIKEDESISAATSLSEAAKFLGLKWNIQDANFQREAKAEQEKDDVEMEKERAQKEAAEKEMEEKKINRKSKVRDGNKVLKKSKTLPSLESKNFEKDVDDKGDLSEKKNPNGEKKLDEQNVNNEIKEVDGKQNAALSRENVQQNEPTKTEDKTQKTDKIEEPVKKDSDIVKLGEKNEIKKDDQQKEKVTDLMPEEKKLVKDTLKTKEYIKNSENVFKEIKEEINIKDIIQMKEQLRRNSIGTFGDLKAKVDKPKPKIPKLKPFQKKITPPETHSIEVRSQIGPLPIIQEKNQEISATNQGALKTASAPATPVAVSTPTTSETPETPGTPVLSEPDLKDLEKVTESTDEDEEEEKDAEVEISEKVETTEAAASASPTSAETEFINSDSGLSEDSKTKAKTKDYAPEEPQEEGKLTEFIQVPGFMICVEAVDGRLASLEWGPQGLHVHCLQFTHVTYDIVIRESLLNSLIPSKSPIVFLELTADHTILGRVYIKLWGHLRRAHNFLSLCLGDQGKSYMNTKFLQVYNISSPGERILGGDYENNTGRGGKGLFDDLEWNGDYAMPMKAGMVTAAGTGTAANNSLFLICAQSDPSRNFSCPFGLVYEGLKVVREAIQLTATKQVWITDCGVVIVPPRMDS